MNKQNRDSILILCGAILGMILTALLIGGYNYLVDQQDTGYRGELSDLNCNIAGCPSYMNCDSNTGKCISANQYITCLDLGCPQITENVKYDCNPDGYCEIDYTKLSCEQLREVIQKEESTCLEDNRLCAQYFALVRLYNEKCV